MEYGTYQSSREGKNPAAIKVDSKGPTDTTPEKVPELPIEEIDVSGNTIITRGRDYLIHQKNVRIMKERKKYVAAWVCKR